MDLWITQYAGVDSSRDSVFAFPDREEAVETAAAFALNAAKEELETFGDDSQHAEILHEIIDNATAGEYDAAVRTWLEYQQDADPETQLAIGPSGSVSASPWDFR